jgi:signal transduction histidine kinase
MSKGAASMKVIINDTLGWSKIQSGAFQVSLGPTRLADMVGSTVVGLSAFAMCQEHRVRLVQEIDPSLPTWLLADKVRLQQVVAIL